MQNVKESVVDPKRPVLTEEPKFNRITDTCYANRENANRMLEHRARRLQEISHKAEKDSAKFFALAKALPQLEGLAEEALYDLVSNYDFNEFCR